MICKIQRYLQRKKQMRRGGRNKNFAYKPVSVPVPDADPAPEPVPDGEMLECFLRQALKPYRAIRRHTAKVARSGIGSGGV